MSCDYNYCEKKESVGANKIINNATKNVKEMIGLKCSKNVFQLQKAHQQGRKEVLLARRKEIR
jgi:hypothetical protein